MGDARHRHAGARPSLRPAQPAQVPVVHRRRPADAGARDRRQHRDLQRRPRRAAAMRACGNRLEDRGPPAACAKDRGRGHQRLGEGDQRLPRADRRARCGRRVPPDVVQHARPRRSVAGPDRRGVGQFLRRARRDAAARPNVPRRRRLEKRAGRAGPQLCVLAACARRRPRDRRPPLGANVHPVVASPPIRSSAIGSAGRRLRTAVGLPVPLGPADDQTERALLGDAAGSSRKRLAPRQATSRS